MPASKTKDEHRYVRLGLIANQIFGQVTILGATQCKKGIFGLLLAAFCTRNDGGFLENCATKTKPETFVQGKRIDWKDTSTTIMPPGGYTIANTMDSISQFIQSHTKTGVPGLDLNLVFSTAEPSSIATSPERLGCGSPQLADADEEVPVERVLLSCWRLCTCPAR